ncbi:MAG: surfeit locus 1 family protein [Sulfitobacter sp.]|jgi:surfeit locus 1 family protein
MTLARPNWRLTVFSLVFTLLFISLSIWQVERGQAKAKMLVDNAAVASLPGTEMSLELEVSNGDPIRLYGKFDPQRVLLLDNRVLAGRVGYEVLQVFEDDSGVIVLVNRGFLAGGRTRAELPEAPIANRAAQSIRGHAYLTELEVPRENTAGAKSPWVIQAAVPKNLEVLVGSTLFGHVIRIEESSPDALPRYWPVTTMLPERHYGYAVTWFLMAVAVVALFIFSLKQESLPREQTGELHD